MAGTKEGGRKAAETNYLRHGSEFYRNIGRKGGANGHTGGFASDEIGKDGLTGKERAIIAGAKGGRISRRGPAK
jgi:general stress protein YciG